MFIVLEASEVPHSFRSDMFVMDPTSYTLIRAHITLLFFLLVANQTSHSSRLAWFLLVRPL